MQQNTTANHGKPFGKALKVLEMRCWSRIEKKSWKANEDVSDIFKEKLTFMNAIDVKMVNWKISLKNGQIICPQKPERVT